MGLVVVYDACVLHPAPLRDFLLRLAGTGLFRARWTDRILDECFDSIRRARPDLDPGRLARTRERMHDAVPDARIDVDSALVDTLQLPDPGDRHVLAAAIAAGARVILTANLRDFPADTLENHGLIAQHPDGFVLELLAQDPTPPLAVLKAQVAALQRPPIGVDKLLETMERLGLVRSTAEMRALLAAGPSDIDPFA